MAGKEFEELATNLRLALDHLASYSQRTISSTAPALNTEQERESRSLQPLVSLEAPAEEHRARRQILSIAGQLQDLLSEPTDIIQRLARQNQLLACLHWLGEFHVLAFIPLNGSIPFKDVAELAGVPETQLRLVIRMSVLHNFLTEPQPAHVAHNAVSAAVLSKPSYVDAILFLSETAAPAALNMVKSTKHYGHSDIPQETAFNLTREVSITFAGALEQEPRLKRQWSAYLRHTVGETETSVTDVLTSFDWQNIGETTLVEVGEPSFITAAALAEVLPVVQIVVQVVESTSTLAWAPDQTSRPGTRRSNPSLIAYKVPAHLRSRVTVQKRMPSTAQTVEGAAVYILHLPRLTPDRPPWSLASQITDELRAHIGVLRDSPSSRLILFVQPFAEHGFADADSTAIARLRDLSLLQLANIYELNSEHWTNMLEMVNDAHGRLVLVSKLRARNNAVVGFEVCYRAHSDSPPL